MADPFFATAMENWSDGLRDLLGPHDEISLTRRDLLRIGASTPGFAPPDGTPVPPGLSAQVVDDLHVVLTQYQHGAHLRLGACSFKAEAGVHLVRTPEDALATILRPNARVAGFIARYLLGGRAASLFLFPWRTIPEWSEFRVFFRNAGVVGATQARRGKTYPEIKTYEDEVRDAIIASCYALRPWLPFPTVAVDLWVEKQDIGFRARLIEINPFVTDTDSGLFDANREEDFDGTFRFEGS